MIRIYQYNQAPKECTIMINSDSLEGFKELVRRGSNLWPDAPPDVKKFADYVLNGRLLQDYDMQARVTSNLRLVYFWSDITA